MFLRQSDGFLFARVQSLTALFWADSNMANLKPRWRPLDPLNNGQWRLGMLELRENSLGDENATVQPVKNVGFADEY